MHTAPDDSGSPDTPRCQKCGYSLVGLECSGVCPECGVEYGPGCTLLELKPSAAPRYQVTIGVLLLGIVGVAISSVGSRPGDTVLISVIAALTAWYAYRWMSSIGVDAYVVLGKRGFHYQHPRLGTKLIPAATLSTCRLICKRRVLVLRDDAGQRLLKITLDDAGGAAELARVASLLRSGVNAGEPAVR